jgi:hypothetical protein
LEEARMRSRTRAALIIASLFVATALLVGCGSTNLRIGWRSFNGSNRKRAKYVSFDGLESKTFRVEAGRTIELASQVTVEKGTLHLELIAPDGERLWGETFSEDRHAFATVSAQESGLYIVRIEGRETEGSFDVSWSVKG